MVVQGLQERCDIVQQENAYNGIVLVLAHLDFVNTRFLKLLLVICACMNTHIVFVLTARLAGLDPSSVW